MGNFQSSFARVSVDHDLNLGSVMLENPVGRHSGFIFSGMW